MDRRDDMMRHFPTILKRWKGGDVRLWNLTIGHPTLVILVSKEGREGCLLIHCGAPSRIEASRYWSNSDFIVEKGEGGFNLLDQSADTRILDCSISLIEQATMP